VTRDRGRRYPTLARPGQPPRRRGPQAIGAFTSGWTLKQIGPGREQARIGYGATFEVVWSGG
jgi:hypothetical protein